MNNQREIQLGSQGQDRSSVAGQQAYRNYLYDQERKQEVLFPAQYPSIGDSWVQQYSPRVGAIEFGPPAVAAESPQSPPGWGTIVVILSVVSLFYSLIERSQYTGFAIFLGGMAACLFIRYGLFTKRGRAVTKIVAGTIFSVLLALAILGNVLEFFAVR